MGLEKPGSKVLGGRLVSELLIGFVGGGRNEAERSVPGGLELVPGC